LGPYGSTTPSPAPWRGRAGTVGRQRRPEEGPLPLPPTSPPPSRRRLCSRRVRFLPRAVVPTASASSPEVGAGPLRRGAGPRAEGGGTGARVRAEAEDPEPQAFFLPLHPHPVKPAPHPALHPPRRGKHLRLRILSAKQGSGPATTS
jgi:hypothetical protein